jgi:acetyl esterase
MSELKYTRYFASDPDWETYARKNGFSQFLPSSPNKSEVPASIRPILSTLPAERKEQDTSEREWAASHPLSSVGYTSYTIQIPTRDGSSILAKISRSSRVPADRKLPLLFVTHGGGWVMSTHVGDEMWLAWPLMQDLDVVYISVDYRLWPEHKYPTFLHDSWDAFSWVLERDGELGFEKAEVVLMGSSAGGCLAASLAMQARDAGVKIKGVVLNVPIVCDPRHFPKSQYEYTSYEQCGGTLLNGGEMTQIWDEVVPVEEGKTSLVSPLLGNMKDLPPHALFVAGQDPLRDEGIAYADKLEASGVKTIKQIYSGVPHIFGLFWDLGVTKQFWEDLRQAVRSFLAE